MKKLSKKQLNERDNHATSLREAKEKVDAAVLVFNEAQTAAFEEFAAAVTAFNQKRVELFAPVAEAIESYNEVATTASEFCENLRNEAQRYYDDKSERWQEGDAGQAHAAWIDEIGVELSSIDLDEPEEIEIDEPDPLDEAVPDIGADELESIPEEPS